MITIKVNGSNNSLVHKGSFHIARNTAPDVCKTPGPPGPPVPVPYPVIISMASDLTGGSTTVKADSGNMIAIKGSQLSRCTGDEPGVAGGIVSSTNMREATWLLYSFDVKIDGQNACRLTDKLKMNHGNTFCMAGIDGLPVNPGLADITAALCTELCNYHKRKPSKKHGKKSSKKLEDHCRKKCKQPNLFFAKRYPSPGKTPKVKTTIPDCALEDGNGKVLQCFDFKRCGPGWKDSFKEPTQFARQKALAGGNPPIEISCDACGCCKC